jgi:hypothetical protein
MRPGSLALVDLAVLAVAARIPAGRYRLQHPGAGIFDQHGIDQLLIFFKDGTPSIGISIQTLFDEPLIRPTNQLGCFFFGGLLIAPASRCGSVQFDGAQRGSVCDKGIHSNLENFGGIHWLGMNHIAKIMVMPTKIYVWW